MHSPSRSHQPRSRKNTLADSLTLEERPTEGQTATVNTVSKPSAKARQSSDVYAVSARRRGDDPTTCDPDYSQEELEFLMAIQEYKQSSGRKFPTWREVLEVLRSLGYERAR